MLLFKSKTDLNTPMMKWLSENKDEIRNGTAVYEGISIDETTVFHQYSCVISFMLGTYVQRTDFLLPTPGNNFLKYKHWIYTVISFLFGWNGIPFGLYETPQAISSNLSGGRKRNAASLLQMIEWGWDAPGDASTIDHRKDIVELTENAAEEILARIKEAKYPAEVAVRIEPADWYNQTVTISFDFPVSDGRDWVDDSQGILLLIEKRHEEQLAGKTIDYLHSEFVCR